MADDSVEKVSDGGTAPVRKPMGARASRAKKEPVAGGAKPTAKRATRRVPAAIESDPPVVITFRLPMASGAASATVVGDFNGWSLSANPMHVEADCFVARIPLAGGRRYRFRYFVDGHRWENDWAADAYVANDFGAEDSVVDLVGPASRMTA